MEPVEKFKSIGENYLYFFSGDIKLSWQVD
jgi:hypothetical protein